MQSAKQIQGSTEPQMKSLRLSGKQISPFKKLSRHKCRRLAVKNGVSRVAQQFPSSWLDCSFYNRRQDLNPQPLTKQSSSPAVESGLFELRQLSHRE